MKKTTTFILIFFVLIFCSCRNRVTSNVEPEMEFTQTVKDSISGTYKTFIDSTQSGLCNIVLEITKIKNQYFYHFKTDSRDVKGKVKLTFEEKELYLTFQGIKWDEYEGDISDENLSTNDSVVREKEIPVGIDALVASDTLHIQNEGNSMNYYTKFGECGRKFIVLAKE